MNKAATQDLRAVRVWPIVRAVLQTGPAPSARAEAAAALLDNWRVGGIEPARPRARREGRRSGRGGDGRRVAAPGRRGAWRPCSGRSSTGSPRCTGASDDAGPGGSAYISGWYGYVDKDLRTLLGRRGARRRTRGATAAPACSRRAASRCGPRSTRPPPSSRRSRGPRRRRGGPTRRPSASGSPPASSRTRCAGRTGRRSSSSCRSPDIDPARSGSTRAARSHGLSAAHGAATASRCGSGRSSLERASEPARY